VLLVTSYCGIQSEKLDCSTILYILTQDALLKMRYGSGITVFW
jgi:hypothetical protein